MNRFQVIRQLGDGSFGSVWKALNTQTNEIVAVKKMKKKYFSWEECMNLREVKCLRKLNHPNIVELKEVVRENDELYFIFECMDCNLYQLIQERPECLSEDQIRSYIFQMLQALAYMHGHGFFHRDMKPENLLIKSGVIKIADFGLSREFYSRPPFTDYVSTRWYRAPEVLLQAKQYGASIDMWAVGAIMAEMFTSQPLFPGASEIDEIMKICSVLGTPDYNAWSEGLVLAKKLNFTFPKYPGVSLYDLIPNASPDAINLISHLCSWDPLKRPSAIECLHHPFFQCYTYGQAWPVSR